MNSFESFQALPARPSVKQVGVQAERCGLNKIR